MKTIKCIGRDGLEREFFCSDTEIEGLIKKKYTYRIRPSDSEPQESFEFTVEEVDNSTVKVVMMNAHNEPTYSAMGISETMIEECAMTLGKTIVSSSNRHKNSDEYRTEPATKVWRRLEKLGRAIYNVDWDRFTFLG